MSRSVNRCCFRRWRWGSATSTPAPGCPAATAVSVVAAAAVAAVAAADGCSAHAPPATTGTAAAADAASAGPILVKGAGVASVERIRLVTVQHKVRIYEEYHSVSPLVGIGTLPTPLSPASVPLPPEPGGGEHTRLPVRGWGSPNSDDWRKSLALCLLCGCAMQCW